MDDRHLACHHVAVRGIHALDEEWGFDPHAVADRLGVDLADVYLALAYYYDHPGTMHDVEQHRERWIEQSSQDGAIADRQDP